MPNDKAQEELRGIIESGIYQAPEDIASAILSSGYVKKERLVLDYFRMSLCPTNCKFINPSENHPYTKGHICELFQDKILHLNYHPRLFRCEKCSYLITILAQHSKELIKETYEMRLL